MNASSAPPMAKQAYKRNTSIHLPPSTTHPLNPHIYPSVPSREMPSAAITTSPGWTRPVRSAVMCRVFLCWTFCVSQNLDGRRCVSIPDKPTHPPTHTFIHTSINPRTFADRPVGRRRGQPDDAQGHGFLVHS